jgi:Heterokaryon incompatibility protein (HET)
MHNSCRRLQRHSRWCPTRLLDIGVPGDLTWKLHICGEEDLSSPNYMTLSYRWGSLPSLKLVQSNIDELRRGNLIEELPQTFRDAITVLRRFSVRYLWIDSLCIVQDSLEDWERESSTMRDIYANSACNISAAASSEPSGGLFRKHQMDAIQPGLVIMSIGSIQKKYYVFDGSYWDRQISNTVLNQRGWVFQERLLAPRVLHFAGHQIFWECFTDQKCEVFARGIPWQNSLKSFEAISMQALGKHGVTSDTALYLWIDLVESYTRCALTKNDDKLPALSGLAHLFHDATGDDYLSGLWRSRLVDLLYWTAERPMRKTPGIYVAPSWSWACGTGPITWKRPRPGYTTLSSVLGAQTQSASSDCAGRVLGGFIKVEGLLLPVTPEEDVTRGRPCVLALRSKPADSNEKIDCTTKTEPTYIIANLDEDFEDTNLGGNRDIYCLILHAQSVMTGRSFSDTFLNGLLLQPASPSSEIFVRIGSFQIRGPDNAEKCGVCIDTEDGSAYLGEGIRRTEITIA